MNEKPKRFQISLQRLLVSMAMFCVLFAAGKAHLQMRTEGDNSHVVVGWLLIQFRKPPALLVSTH